MRRILREFPKLIHSWYGSVWKRPVHVFNLLLNIKPARIMQTSLAGSDSSKLNSTLNGSNDRRQLTRAENRAYLATNHLVLSFRHLHPFSLFSTCFSFQEHGIFSSYLKIMFLRIAFQDFDDRQDFNFHERKEFSSIIEDCRCVRRRTCKTTGNQRGK